MTPTPESPAAMTTATAPRTYAVIGAGAAGLTAAKNLLEQGIEVEVFEGADDLGGNWNYGKPKSSIYRSVHTITSKPFTSYTDHPMPEHYPTFIGHREALEYLRSYADRFGVTARIRFSTEVAHVERVADTATPWLVRLANGETKAYAGLVIANGHLWSPRFPDYPGTFDGVVLHSSEYKTPDVLRGKRALIVGAGNSGCDIAVEASQNAQVTLHSTRRGYYYWPKYLFGQPSDVVYELALKTRAPLPVRRAVGHALLRLNTAGQPQHYGLAKPEQKLYDEHFIINSTLMYHLGHGDIAPVPDIAELMGDRVRFTDGSVHEVDVIVYATGFNLFEFPFIDHRHLNWRAGTPHLFMQAFHPLYDDVFVIGHFQTSTGNWPLMDYQSQIMARFIRLNSESPESVAWFRDRKRGGTTSARLAGGLRYYNSERHAIEVEHFAFRGELQSLAARLERTLQRTGTRRGVSDRSGTPSAIAA